MTDKITNKITKIVLTGGPCAGKTTAMAQIIERGDCDTHDAAEKRADKIGKLRAEYYNFYTDKTVTRMMLPRSAPTK